MWQVRDDEAVGHAAVLLQNDEVAEAFGAARVNDRLHRVPAAVHPLRVRDEKLHLLEELRQLAARVVRRRDEDLWVGNARVGVLRVDAKRIRRRRAARSRLVRRRAHVIERELLSQAVGLAPELGGQRRTALERLAHLAFAVDRRVLARCLRLLVEVLAARARLTA